jgi:hypothetical protein
MSWLYWYTKYRYYKKYELYKDPRFSVGSAFVNLDPAAADVYKLKVAAYPDDVAEYISYTMQNNIMTADDWASVFNVYGVDPDFLASVLNSQYMPTSYAAAILNSQYMSLSRAVAIVNSQNLSGSKATGILKDANILANTVQSILYNIPFSDRLIDILTATAPDVTLNANATFSGVNIFRTLNLNGHTYTAGGQPHVIIAKAIYIPTGSKLVKTPTGGAGGAAPGPGGAGGGGLIIFTSLLNNADTISADGATPQQPNCNTGNGANGGAGVFGLLSGNSYTATGGSGGGGCNSYGDATGGGGPKGASYTYGCTSGAGGDLTTTTFTVDTVRKALIDWYIKNVLGKSPTTTTAIPNFYGAGGGAGCGYNNSGYVFTGAGGGGSGGEIIVIAITLNNTGSITALGGGGQKPSCCYPGSFDIHYSPSGAGGVIYVFYKTLQSLGTLNVSGNQSGLAKAVAI